MPILQEQKSVQLPASRDIRPPWMAEVQILQDAYMDVGARAMQEQLPRKYLPVLPVHGRYRRPASRDIPHFLYIKKGQPKATLFRSALHTNFS